jgi:hypothetical protein
MGVIDGQSVSAAVTNAAFLSKNANDSTAYNLSLGATLNFPKNVISTGGTINALDSTKVNVKLTGASVVLNGAVAGSDGQILIIYAGNATPVTINSLSGSASAVNQFKLTASSYSLAAGSAAIFVYDSTLANWVIIGTMDGVSATSSNTASTIVKRDASGNFSAGTITASLSGSATSFTGSLSGDVTGGQSTTVVASVGGSTAANVHAAELLANAATNLNTASAIIKRDASGNFIASQASLTSLLLNGSISGNVTISPAATTTSYALTLPAAQGASSTTLVNDGTGVLSWGSSGSGGGGGAKNYFTLSSANPSFENSTISPWSACTLTLSSGIPSGAPTLSATQMTLASTATNPLIGTKSGQLTKSAANAQGQGFISGALTIDREDTAKILSGSFSYEVVSGTIDLSGSSTQSLEIWIYNTVSGAWTQPVGYRGMNQGSGQGKCVFTFQTDGSTANNSYKIAIITAQTATTAYVVNFDDFQIGPQTIAIGPVVTDWQSYTLTIGATTTAPTAGTTTVNSAKWRRVGDTMEITYQFEQTAAGSAGSGDYLFPIPAGFSVDTTKLTALNPARTIVGDAKISFGLATSGATTPNASVLLGTANPNAFKLTYPNTTIEGTATVNNVNYGLSAGSLSFSFFARVPILGWSSNVQMSSDSYQGVVAFYANNNGASTTSVPTGSSGTKVLNLTPVFDTNSGWNATNQAYTIPVSGYYDITASIYTGSFTTNVDIGVFINGSYVEIATSPNTTGSATTAIGNRSFSLSAGTTVSLGTYQNSGSTQNYGAYNPTSLKITRISGPSVLAATETVACNYYTTAGTSVPTSGSVLVYGTKNFDTNGAYNTSTGIYTAPVSGKYFVSAQYATTSSTIGTFFIQVLKNGSVYSQTTQNRLAAIGSTMSPTISTIINCNAGDTLQINFQTSISSQTLTTNSSENNLSILRVGN